ncbi:hypothetical protein C465_04339 [Halorubrum distributum JCM 9100]|uniref:Nucleotidase n=1 Tax=Halorubrum distributum JCM 9100 TaxID=1227467 RepID=M0EXK4_9EURY|nr:hypothetical protein C465_04339 [Halorubrum distributum JCM 9100]
MIAVDFDGVVTSPHALKSQEFQIRGYDISEQQTDRNYCLNVRNIEKADYEAVSHAVNVARLDQVPIRNKAAAGLQQLVDEGLYPVLVTSRHDEEIPPMLRYVRKHRLPVSEYLNTGRDPKIDAAKTLGARIIVDDSLSKLERFLEEEDGEWTLIFFQNKANSYVESVPERVHVVDGWDALVTCILQES